MKAIGTRVRIPEGTDGVAYYLHGAKGTITGHRFNTIDDREVNVLTFDEPQSAGPGWRLEHVGLSDHQLEEIES